jgi:PKD repeat protein
MKKLTVTLLLFAFVLSGAAMANKMMVVDRENAPSFLGFAGNKCIIVLKDDAPAITATPRNGIAETGISALDAIHNRFGVNSFGRQFKGADPNSDYPTVRALTKYYKAYFPAGNLEAIMAAYRKLPFVEKVDPVAIHTFQATPNDYYYDDSTAGYPYYQWHYWDTYGIDADQAWDQQTGDATVVVGIMDSGVRYYHHDIGGTDPPGPADNVTNGNVWVNPYETPNDGIDNEGNGYVDDVIGWDFVETSGGPGYSCIDADCGTADNDPRDGDGHGTHVAGTVAAFTNNDPTWGVAGVAGGWNDGTMNYTSNGVKLMCLRIGYLAKYRGIITGIVQMDYAAEAMYYVADMVERGVNVAAINCSWGSTSYGAMPAATDNLLAHDVMIIVAAGNDNSSSCDYLGCRTDCLDVGGTERSGNPYYYSNYGSWIEVAAPAVDITSTYHNYEDPDYDYISLLAGTSMACPHVVAVAALLESKDPTLTGPEKFAIIANPDNMNSYNQTKYVGAGIVSAKKCLDAVGPGCDLVADFSGSPTSGCAPLTVSFTDLSTGTGIDGWDWDFGDGGSSTAQNPSYQYDNAGTYTVSLTVSSSSQNCSKQEIKTGYITVYDIPVADFSGSPTSGDAPLTVDFTDLSTGNPTTWDWDFGDGVGTSDEQNPSYTYNDSGTYTVTLTAGNICGSDVETKIDYITVTEAQQVVMHVADIQVTRETAGGPNRIGVANVKIVDAGGAAVSGATVYGYFNAPNSNTKTGVTETDGYARVQSDKDRNPPADWCFTVTDVTKSGATYNPDANDVTQACESGPVYKFSNAIIPAEFDVYNYPNPFNPTTTFALDLPKASHWTLSIYNVAGQKIDEFSGYSAAGIVSFDWDASDLGTGIYFYKATTDDHVMTNKMILLK